MLRALGVERGIEEVRTCWMRASWQLLAAKERVLALLGDGIFRVSKQHECHTLAVRRTNRNSSAHLHVASSCSISFSA